MQNRTSVLSFLVVAAGTAALLATTATSQLGAPKAFVSLQPTTPGTSQSGHANVSGTLTAGQLVGGGAGISGVNADLLDGINSTAFLTGVPSPLALTGASAGSIIFGENNSNVLASTGVKGVSNASSGRSFGVLGENASSQGTGVVGSATSTGFQLTFGVQGWSASPNGRGVYGVATNMASGLARGVEGNSYTTEGVGVFGQALSSSGATFGGQFQSDSTSGSGVFGMATANSGVTYGLFGQVQSPDGYAVYGKNNGSSGSADGVYGRSESPTGRGVVGYVPGSGATYAVLGWCDSSPVGYGVFAQGTSGASGTKSFRIDHPFDPENKYLLHYSSESPMPQNFYVGNVVTDSKGYAWVELPDYFSEINTNFKYQLTVVGKTFAQAIVWEKIQDNRFQIRTNEPNIEVSWRVDADRNDLYVRDRKPRDVIEKQGRERGTYQHPELYGMPKERGMNYRLEDVRLAAPAKPNR